MKLIRLKLNDNFRSLKAGFEVSFLPEWNRDQADSFNPYVLAGRNGSGKSNLLEVLASIFYHLECMYLENRPDNFDYDADENPAGYRSDKAHPDAFELEYLITVPEELREKAPDGKHAHIKIEKQKEQSPLIFWVKNSDPEESEFEPLEREEIKKLLPAYIVGYSSGENEILSFPFLKMGFIHYDEYLKSLKEQLPYYDPEGRLIFLDNQFSQAILLSNFLMQDQNVLKAFETELGLNDIKEFRILIGKIYNEVSREPIQFSSGNSYGNKETTIGLTSKKEINDIIEIFKKCSTSYFIDILNDEHIVDAKGRFIVDAKGDSLVTSDSNRLIDKEYLILDFWVNDATREAFQFYFEKSPFKLFQAFYILLTLNSYIISKEKRETVYRTDNIFFTKDFRPALLEEEAIFTFKDFCLKKRGADDFIYTKSLSDGEHQFLHSLGLCLLFKDKPCLFLLDEPETHFNPDWRAKFISSLRDCFGHATGDITREMLITTHSPFLISDSQKEYVLLFEKDGKTGTVSVTRPDSETFGASVNKITMEVFGKRETIGGRAEKELMKLKERLERGEDRSAIMHETNRLLGDSIEKVLFINYVLNRE